MAFAYYNKLSKARKAIYRKSDRVHVIKLHSIDELRDDTAFLEQALVSEKQKAVRSTCQLLANRITGQLGAPTLKLRVLARRPSDDWGELHGLYEPADENTTGQPRITVWMRTAKRKQVVAFKSFLRTLLHEVCHHIDYECLELEESFHTEGFYKRESSLLYQLLPKST